MGTELLIGIASTLISSITTIIVVVLICARLGSVSFQVRSRRRRTRRSLVRLPCRIETRRDCNKER
jgi:hypothetical protein